MPKTFSFDESFEHTMGSWRSADITHADKKNSDFIHGDGFDSLDDLLQDNCLRILRICSGLIASNPAQ